MDYLNALLKKPVGRTPIWIMRQAGRYLPEYRKTRQQAGDFLTLCKTPELACEVTLQPLRRFDLDAAIIFSDILTIPDAMNLGLKFIEGEGPVFSRPLRKPNDIEQLPTLTDTDDLSYVGDALRLVRQNLAAHIALIGFCGSPWTMATYMIEGGSSKTFSQIKKWLYQDPDSLQQLLNKLTDAATAYLTMQINSGADSLMIFDTWGGLLTPQHYERFSLAYMRTIINRVNHDYPHIPITVFTKGGGLWLDKIAASGCTGVGLDWTIDIAQAKQQIGEKVALQGNLDPSALYASFDVIRREAKKITANFANESGFVFNLGHGITPDINPDCVKVLVDCVHEHH